ncbi:MAG: FAD-dependent oxidoreductase [Verrucomicrobiota bacterium]
MSRIAVIGSGISGLVCARDLMLLGHEVVVFEKSRSLGGRCATRKWRDHIVDHGAQYFTASTETFLKEIRDLLGDNLCILDGSVVDELGNVIQATAGVRYYNRQGNNRTGSALARDLNVQREVLVESIERGEGPTWKVCDDYFDAVVLTAPWPQTAKLLGESSVAPEFVPCLTAFFEYTGKWAGQSQDQYAVSIRDSSALHYGVLLLWTTL